MDNNINSNINAEIMKGAKVLLCPTYDLAKTVANVDNAPYATVEAEYGEHVITGSPRLEKWATLAHHDSRSSNPAPCVWNSICEENVSPMLPKTIIVSHLDLDTLGGIGLLLGYYNPEEEGFWKAAAHIDCVGPHHILEVPEKAQKQLRAFWAYNENNRHQFPRDKVTDVTAIIAEYFILIGKISEMDEVIIKAGEDWETLKKEQTEGSLVYESNAIRGFCGQYFTASSYCGSNGVVRSCTISYSTKKKAITIAFEDGGKKHNAAEIMRNLFGAGAGGHAGIAGTPRGKEYNVLDLARTIQHVEELLSK